MKKLLAILASVSLVASSASAVVACSDTEATKYQPNQTNMANDLTNESINSVKSLVLADQYGLDLDKTNSTVNTHTDITTPDFNQPNASIAKGLNLNGTLGKENGPLFAIGDKINDLLSKIKQGPIDFSSVIKQWGGVIQNIPALLNAGDITGLMGLIPTLINSLTQLVPDVDIDPSVITWIGDWVKMNIKYVLKEIDFNSKIREIINNAGGSCTISDIQKEGAKSLTNILNLFFSGYANSQVASSMGYNDSDNPTSVFLGSEIIQPIWNKTSVDVDKIKKIFTNKYFYIAHMKDLLDNAVTLISSLLITLTVYVPKVAQTPKDADHLFADQSKTNEDIFKQYDSASLTVDKTTQDIKLGNEIDNVSLNDAIFGSIDFLSDTKKEDLGILKFTTILFHDQGSTPNPLLSTLTKIVVDSLKFVDYEVKVVTTPNDENNRIAIDKSNQIALTIDFKLNDLFKKNDITLAKYYLWVGAFGVGTWTNPADVHLNIKGNGLTDASDSLIEPLLNAIISGSDNIKTVFENSVSKMLSSSSSLYITFGSIPAGITKTIVGIFEGKIWDKVSGVLTNLLTTIWYTSGDDFYKGLKQLGLSDDQVASIKASIGDTFPLSNKILVLLQNVNIGGTKIDVTQLENYLNIDKALNILDIIFLRNPIQDVNKENSFKDDEDDSQDKSLFEQILISLNETDKVKQAQEWNYYLGYVSESDNKWDQKSKYVYRNGLIGNIVEVLYPKLSDANSKVKGTLEDPNEKGFGQEISLLRLGLLHSDVMDKFTQAMDKFANTLKGDDLNDIVDPLYDNNSLWKVSNVTNRFFNGTYSLQYESYDLTFDTSSVSINHTDNNGNVITLPTKKVTYRITFSRIDPKSPFDYKSIEKLN